MQYAALDVYSRMLKRAGEKDETMSEKLKLCETINTLLLATKQEYLRKCKYCGAPLPPGFQFNVCDRCFRRPSRRREWFTPARKAERILPPDAAERELLQEQ